MSHRLLGATAVVALLGLLTGATAVANAGPSNVSFGHSHRVCALPVGGEAACDAYVVADAATGAPLAMTSYTYGYAPASLSSAYGPFGRNKMTIAIVDAYAHPAAAADLAVYRAQFRLGKASLQQYNQDGGPIDTVAANVGWGREEMLDLEMASAICPQCSLIYVGANSASLTDLAAAVTRAAALGAQVISNSYGARESHSELAVSAWNIPGVAVTVSSGDGGYGTEFPATSAGVIAVGGTSLSLTADGHRDTETAWSGTGSGCSSYIAKPAWQIDAGCAMRTITDVAAVADPYTGVAVYDSYGSTGGANWYVFGGTSVSAPLIAAMFARGRDFAPGEQVAARLYANPQSLYDVTSGSNGKCSTRTNTLTQYLCTAGPGYDGPTGNGAPNGDASAF